VAVQRSETRESQNLRCSLASHRRISKVILCVCCLSAVRAWGDGHGPAFGYSTTVLGVHDSSVETSVMWRLGSAMTGSKFSYGWRENLQFSVSTTFHLNPGEHPVGRFTATMPGNPEIEGLSAWRFLHKSTGIATRNECTLFVGGSALTQQPLRADGPPLDRQPGLYGAVATGHISRTYSVWAGAGFQHYGAWNSHELDHQSDSFLTSLALGWRPTFLARDYPKPDFRFFWETTGERIGHAWRSATEPVTTPPGGGGHYEDWLANQSTPNSSGVVVLPNSGGSGVYSAQHFFVPTVA
jgi:hypothetical protein